MAETHNRVRPIINPSCRVRRLFVSSKVHFPKAKFARNGRKISHAFLLFHFNGGGKRV